MNKFKWSITRKNSLRSLAVTLCAFFFSYQVMGVVSSDKKLSNKEVKSLTKRTTKEVYSSTKDELKYIGMPIGGIACGQLYISGDGNLWLWDIFQSNYKREGPAGEDGRWRMDQFTFGSLYPSPRESKGNNLYDVKQGTAIQVKANNKEPVRLKLNDQDFDEVTFRGEYPVAKVNYKKDGLPLNIELLATPSYIPLNIKESSIPATLMRYKITNTGNEQLEISLGSWLENKVSPTHQGNGYRKNTTKQGNNRVTVFMEASGEGLDQKKGFGNMALSLMGKHSNAQTISQLNNTDLLTSLFGNKRNTEAQAEFKTSLIGGINTTYSLQKGETVTVDFLVSWYFPYLKELEGDFSQIKDIETLNRYYSKHFNSADDVADYFATNAKRLVEITLKWNEVWYDSSLPYWFLDRTFIPINCLATQVAHYFDNERFWGWEGVDCCQGTCIHVWQYAQAMARIFPELEKGLRQKVDFDIAYRDGLIGYRGENGMAYAIDGQLGTIIRTYREHQMSTDKMFLTTVWDNVKEAMRYVMKQDKDGLITGQQPHTLDAAWYGPMGWINSLYLGALKSCEEMALEVGDTDFATECNSRLQVTQQQMVKKLFNGAYFIHLNPDTKRINSNTGCHIDQLLGLSMAHQVNITDLLPEQVVKKALQSIWQYNYLPNVGKYAEDHTAIRGERCYAVDGDAGVVMTTWPEGGAEDAVPGMADRPIKSDYWVGPGGYFDEVWTGQEYQLASHMIDNGMITEGLAIVKAVHERYAAAKRNPYDEIECSSHYARAMASYGAFISASGYQYHGPKGILGFAPKISPENFKSAFTSAKGWGSFAQVRKGKEQHMSIELAYGELYLKEFNAELPEGKKANSVKVQLNGKDIELTFHQEGQRVVIDFKELKINSNDSLKVNIKL
ncbi:hypothetical protein EYV94_24835 [Puteibacter caeruleilacunae]|nr:hypothetical protein EYV94_24835 [Puteibacter caeruleilacunae]